MTTHEQEAFINQMYIDIFQQADLKKIPKYFSADFVEDNNYDVLDHPAFVAHVEELSKRSVKAKFNIEFLVNVPGQVVIRTLVYSEDQIDGAPPLALLISYWGFNSEGLVNRCIEVEHDASVG